MMSLQLYQNASQGPRKLELLVWNVQAEVRDLNGSGSTQHDDRRTGDLHESQGPHQATSSS
jgi:hypothetical protein